MTIESRRITEVDDSAKAATHSRRFTRTAPPPGSGEHNGPRIREAVARAKEGDSGALHFLYLRYADEVFGYVSRIVGNDHDAEDVTQNVFGKLMRAIGSYEPRQVPFAAWLLRVARNAALDHVRARRQLPFEEVRVSTRDDDYADVERLASLRAALGRLSQEQLQVMLLLHIGGLEPGEVATRMGKSPGAVYGLHHRARLALTASLKELEAAPVTGGG